jgi:hypothetical protein
MACMKVCITKISISSYECSIAAGHIQTTTLEPCKTQYLCSDRMQRCYPRKDSLADSIGTWCHFCCRGIALCIPIGITSTSTSTIPVGISISLLINQRRRWNPKRLQQLQQPHATRQVYRYEHNAGITRAPWTLHREARKRLKKLPNNH